MEVSDQHVDEWAIEAQKLIKSYGNHHAVKGIDLTVKWGEKLAIFGPNGAGKTTLLNLLATLIRPSSGEIWIGGYNVRFNSVEARRQIGVVSHRTLLYDDLSAHENLKFYGKMYDVQNLEERIQELLSIVGLETRIDDSVRTLSRGMQQRVAIARALIHDPPILLLDEPGTGLDQHASDMLGNILNLTDNKQRTVVVTTHSLEQGLALSNRAVILCEGKIAYEESEKLEIGNLRDVYYQYTGVRY